jgi:hypothetical protein
MRALGGLIGLILTIGVGFGVYRIYLERMPVTDKGTAVTQAIDLTGVRMDLMQIAQAERGYIATNGECVDLQALAASDSLGVAKTERSGYVYSVACHGHEYTVTANHAPAPPDSPIRYPLLAIDQDMQVSEVH